MFVINHAAFLVILLRIWTLLYNKALNIEIDPNFKPKIVHNMKIKYNTDKMLN